MAKRKNGGGCSTVKKGGRWRNSCTGRFAKKPRKG